MLFKKIYINTKNANEEHMGKKATNDWNYLNKNSFQDNLILF